MFKATIKTEISEHMYFSKYFIMNYPFNSAKIRFHQIKRTNSSKSEFYFFFKCRIYKTLQKNLQVKIIFQIKKNPNKVG